MIVDFAYRLLKIGSIWSIYIYVFVCVSADNRCIYNMFLRVSVIDVPEIRFIGEFSRFETEVNYYLRFYLVSVMADFIFYTF